MPEGPLCARRRHYRSLAVRTWPRVRRGAGMIAVLQNLGPAKLLNVSRLHGALALAKRLLRGRRGKQA